MLTEQAREHFKLRAMERGIDLKSVDLATAVDLVAGSGSVLLGADSIWSDWNHAQDSGDRHVGGR
jgi:hypothetical protein